MTNPDGSPTGAGYEGFGGIAGGVGQVLGGAIDTFVGSETAKRNTDATIEAQRYEAEKAYQRQVQMWNMQNLYNSPAEQMKRFGAAGLNPHLIYGQGSPGNANNYPQYSPPNIQYRYEAPAYGAAVNSLLPTLMGVGTWMQNMRLSETEIREKETGMDKTNQLIEFLREQNPRRLQELDNRLSVFPFQYSMQREGAQKAQVNVADMLEEFRYKWGAPLEGLQHADYQYSVGTGRRKVELLKLIAEQRMASNKADWSDYGVTDPQNLYTMILRGVMGMTGKMLSPAGKEGFKQKWTPPPINRRRRGFQR